MKPRWKKPSWRQLYVGAGVTLAPAAIYVTGQLPPPHAEHRPAHASDVPALTQLSPAYGQGSATYNPRLGQPIFLGGSALA
jgi:hypothetical protein